MDKRKPGGTADKSKWLRALYKQRNRIERIFGHLKINRAIATRYDQLANTVATLVPLSMI